MFPEPHPNGKLEILYQLYDDTPSYYQSQAKSREAIIEKADPKDFKSAFDTIMNPNENNVFRCISVYTINQFLGNKKLDNFLLTTRNDYLPLYLLDNLNFHENIETKSRFGLGFPDMINLGYPSISKLFVYLYNLNPNWPELTSIITQNPPKPHHICLYLLLNMPLSTVTTAFEGSLKQIRLLPYNFVSSIVQYKEDIPIELIARFLGDLRFSFFEQMTYLFVRYQNSMLSNKQLFTHASSVDILVRLFKFDIYTPFDINFEETVKILTEHFCVIDGEQRGYKNPPVYTEFRVYLKKASEMHPDKYAKFLAQASEDELSAFSFEYDENVAKRIFDDDDCYCPWVYVVLFHDKIPKEMVPWNKIPEFEPAPDLVNSIKLYNGIDANLLNEFVNTMSAAKFVYLFHDYYDCKSIPNLKYRLLNDRRDYDPQSILYDSIEILGDAVDLSHDLGKYLKYGRLSSFDKLINDNLYISKEDAKFQLSNKYFLTSPYSNSHDIVFLLRKILHDYPEFIDEFKEQLEQSYFAPLFLKEFIPDYEYDPLNPIIIVMLANSKNITELNPKQIEILISIKIPSNSYSNYTFEAMCKALFTLELNENDKICQLISNLIEYFILSDCNYYHDEMPQQKQFLSNLQHYLKQHPNIRQELTTYIPKALENVFDYIDLVYNIKI